MGGFKCYWRKLRQDHPGLIGRSRRYRRRLALEWYHEDKRKAAAEREKERGDG